MPRSVLEAPTGRPSRLVCLAAAALTLMAFTGLTGTVGAQTPSPDGPALIDNGVVQLGVQPHGQLLVAGGPPSSETGTTTVGLRHLPTGAESLGAGTAWGVADAVSGARGFAGATSGPPVANLTLVDFQTTGTDAVSTVEMRAPAVNPGSPGTPVLEVTHDYHPSAVDGLYEVTVTLENLSSASVEPRYRSVLQWDVEPTAAADVLTLAGIVSPHLLFSSNDGTASPNPLSGPSDLGLLGPPSGAFFADEGPMDHGALVDLGFASLAPGASVYFNLYYGASADEGGALLSLDQVGAAVFSLAQPSTAQGPSVGTPNTFAYAFGEVDGQVTPRLVLRKRADDATVAPGDGNGYTVELTNPTGGSASVTDIIDTLPPGFSYVPGSATIDGAATADPAVTLAGGQATLEWAGPVTVAALDTRELHFDVAVDANAAEGEYHNVAGATAVTASGAPLAVESTGPVAPVVVAEPPPVVATEVTPSSSTGAVVAGDEPGTFVVSMALGGAGTSDLTVTSDVLCPDGSTPSSVVLRHGTTDHPMTETPSGSGTYTATIPAASLTLGPVWVVAVCGSDEIVNEVGGVVLFDPSGVVTDADTGDPVPGATVTLHKMPFALPDTSTDTRDCRTVDTRTGPDWSSTAPGDPATSELADPLLQPAEMSPLVNPQTTGADGRYGWDVARGCWFVVVAAPGYVTETSALVGVPPEVLDLDVALEPLPPSDPCDPHTAMPFADVSSSNPHRAAIACAAGLGIVRGTSTSTFAPAGDVTRAQFASMLARMLTAAGLTLPPSSATGFTDIAGSTHEDAIRRLASAGVVNGVTPTTFAPQLPVTRAQAASLLRRAHDLAADSPLPAGPDAFDDDGGIVHEGAIDALSASGVINGTGPRRFDPQVAVHRDQVTSLVVRMLRLLAAAG